MEEDSGSPEPHLPIVRAPCVNDGAKIHALVSNSAPLDVNSRYCYLLLCRYFDRTCVVAEEQGEIIGFISGFRPPHRADVFFVWQVAVDSQNRRRGLGKRMLHELLHRPESRGIRFLETTVTRSNEASRLLFQALARALDAPCEESVCFSEADFGPEAHEPEYLVRIGPFSIEKKEVK
ncbi:MAG TPA: diaminobutyrate acetyltransferase [Methanomicrobia archaeon]|nr:diaminobutyrate acetyltransferase [Methanomicrobia archaeon]